ncbi:integrase domain-containing protein [Ferrimonas sp. YFM]|uniref:integrase domain-containing protein n=1 Tax=Ferrimonas sp. YFM TaxID=3028878 RepID=UPI0025743B8C|nr:integrase domain-containing protein [Ferrimonas sp. YFM]BDY03816.1 integrase [Ferrimonas sp. YFM]
MPRIVKPLTDTQVRGAKPKAAMYRLNDGNGLQLKVKPNGSKHWFLDYYRPTDKKRTSLGLGAFPEVGLADAREAKRAAKALLAKGVDPKAHREQQQLQKNVDVMTTLEAVAKDWMLVKQSKVSADYAEDIRRSLEMHLFPKLGTIPIKQLTAPMAIECLRPLEAKGSLEQVKRVIQRLNEIMRHAVNTGVVHANPMSGIRAAFKAPTKDNLPTLRPDELPMLMKRLQRMNTRPTTRLLIEWQLHTMVRPSEAAGAHWKEIDMESRTWRIPASRMKRKKEHWVALSSHALSLLEELKGISGEREHLFPGDRVPSRPACSQTANAALKRAGFSGKLVSHGLRALASTTLNEAGFPPDLIESALAHADRNEVRAAYNRAQYVERRRPMMEWWSNQIAQASLGQKPATNCTTISVIPGDEQNHEGAETA